MHVDEAIECEAVEWDKTHRHESRNRYWFSLQMEEIQGSRTYIDTDLFLSSSLLFRLPRHLVRCSFGMVASTRSAASKSWRRISCYRLTDKAKYVQQQKRLGERGRSTKAFAWESSWGQREKSKRREGVESKKAAIKAHNKDNDRRETQDLSRTLT